ncbi:MAG: pyridoxamine 5'-phosphate oxidase family protein [Microbacterium sp.]
MYETRQDHEWLDELLRSSRADGTAHLRTIIDGDRAADAEAVLSETSGMRVLALSTVTRRGEPRVSAVDGHLLHGQWTFGTDGAAAKARHLGERPSVSAAYIDAERFAVFTHGTAIRIVDGDPWGEVTRRHWTEHYGSDPLTWGDDIRMYRIEPTWMVAYRGVPA